MQEITKDKNSKRRSEWNKKEVQAVKKMQEQPVDWEAIDRYVAAAGGKSMPGRKDVGKIKE